MKKPHNGFGAIQDKGDYNAEGERQIGEYLDYFGLTTGYMLSFNFHKQYSE